MRPRNPSCSSKEACDSVQPEEEWDMMHLPDGCTVITTLTPSGPPPLLPLTHPCLHPFCLPPINPPIIPSPGRPGLPLFMPPSLPLTPGPLGARLPSLWPRQGRLPSLSPLAYPGVPPGYASEQTLGPGGGIPGDGTGLLWGALLDASLLLSSPWALWLCLCPCAWRGRRRACPWSKGRSGRCWASPLCSLTAPRCPMASWSGRQEWGPPLLSGSYRCPRHPAAGEGFAMGHYCVLLCIKILWP